MTTPGKEPFLRLRWPWLALAAAAIAVRLLYLLEFSASPLYAHAIGPDVGEYAGWAREILAGRVLWPEVHIHSPLYPFFLAALYEIGGLSNPFVRVVQSLLVLAAAVPLLAAMRRAGDREENHPLGQQGTLLLAGALWAVYPPLVYHSAELVSESLLLPLLCLALWLLYRADTGKGRTADQAAAGAGVAVGLAVLTHPVALFFLLAESLWLACLALFGMPTDRPAVRRRCLFFVLAAGLALAPVVGYNLLFLKGPPLQANGGFNFWLGNGPGADGTCRLRPGPAWDRAHREGEAQARLDGVGTDRHFLGETLDIMVSRPGRAIRLMAAKSLYALNFRELIAGADAAPLREFTPFMRWTRGAFAVLGIAALALLLLRLRNRAFLFACRHFLILGGALWCAQILFVASGRYRLGMLPTLIPLAALGMGELATRRRDGRPRPWTVAAVAIAAAIVLVPRPSVHPEIEQVEADTILAEAWLADGHADLAEPLLKQNVLRQPEWSRHHNLLGLALRELGRDDEAAAAFHAAAELAPDEPDAWMNLAVLEADRGRAPEAEAAFAQAFLTAIPSADLEYNYALFQHHRGRLDEASAGYRAAIALNPAHRRARANLGAVFLIHDLPQEALAEIDIAIRLAPDDPRLRINRAAALVAADRLPDARRELDRLLRRQPDLPAARELRRQLDAAP